MPITTENKQQFDQFAQSEYNDLFYRAQALTKNRWDAEDLVQETFLRAYRFMNKYRENTNLRGWFFTILRNTFINKYRKDKKRPKQTQVDTIEFALADEYQSKDQTQYGAADDVDINMIFSDDIKNGFLRMPKHFRDVIMLVDVKGTTYKEAAEVLDCPLGTVMSRLHRGRTMIRRNLAHIKEEELLRN